MFAYAIRERREECGASLGEPPRRVARISSRLSIQVSSYLRIRVRTRARVRARAHYLHACATRVRTISCIRVLARARARACLGAARVVACKKRFARVGRQVSKHDVARTREIGRRALLALDVSRVQEARFLGLRVTCTERKVVDLN